MEEYNTLDLVDKKLLELEQRTSELEKLRVDFNQLKGRMAKTFGVVDSLITIMSSQDAINASVKNYMKSKEVMNELKKMLLKTATGETVEEKLNEINTTMYRQT